MTRAYLVPARVDLAGLDLQILDIKPNSSQFSPAYNGQGTGQTGYLPPSLIDGINADGAAGVATAVGANITVDGDNYGLSTYLLCRIEDDNGGGNAITAAQAYAISGDILAAVASGAPLTLAEINGFATAQTGGANGIGVGNSDATVEEILRILAGERFRALNALEIENAGGVWQGPGLGEFVTRPNIQNPASVVGSYGGVRGRKSTAPLPYIRPGEVRAGQAPVQGSTEDIWYRDIRLVVDTSDIHLSTLSGALGALSADSFAFKNPAFTYGPAGTALTLGGNNILATGAARAITIYDALGNVI